MTILLAFLLGASAFDGYYDTSVEAYNQEDYVGAIDLLVRLAEQGAEDPAVYYTLGNAYYRQGRLAPAIASYEHALQLDPGLDEARDNLARSIQQTQRGLAKPPPPVWEQRLLFWHSNIKPRTARTLALAGWSAFWFLLALRQFRPTRYLRRIAALTLLLTLALAASAWTKANPRPLAVAGAGKVPVHYGTNEQETIRFELYEGDRVIVDQRMNGWARVTTVDGERGWARDELLVAVDRPWLGGPPIKSTPKDHQLSSLGSP